MTGTVVTRTTWGFAKWNPRPLVLGALFCAAVALVFLVWAIVTWQDDVDIVEGQFDGTVCGDSVYGVMTVGPPLGPDGGEGAQPPNPGFQSACIEAAEPAWAKGKNHLRVAVLIGTVAILLGVISAFDGGAQKAPLSFPALSPVHA